MTANTPAEDLPTPEPGAAVDDAASRAEAEAVALRFAHDDARVDEWEEESFPASDPPENY